MHWKEGPPLTITKARRATAIRAKPLVPLAVRHDGKDIFIGQAGSPCKGATQIAAGKIDLMNPERRAHPETVTDVIDSQTADIDVLADLKGLEDARTGLIVRPDRREQASTQQQQQQQTPVVHRSVLK